MADEPTADSSTATFDMDAAMEKIGDELFPNRQESEKADGPVAEGTVTPVTDSVETTTPEPTIRTVPKSWPKEMHEHWGKVDPKVQEYWETREKQMLDGLDQYKGDATYGKTIREVLAPYEQIIKQNRLEPHQAVQSLLVAHTRLTQGTPEQRQAAYEELGRNLGITQPTQNGGPPLDPTVKAIQDELQSMKQTLTAQQQAAYDAALKESNKEVETFASDTKAHPYFDEIADDIVKLIQVGHSLQEAYDKAVWSNPVTREKELAKAREAEAIKLKENARLDALKAKTAASTNVRSRDSKRTPTEPIGTMEDTIKSTLAGIRTRVS